jgi:hypothetical protein
MALPPSARATLHALARFGSLVLCLVLTAVLGCGTSEPDTSEPSAATKTYRDDLRGWSWTYPASWRLQTFDDEQGGTHVRGALVSSVDRTYERPTADTIAWDLRDLPTHAVVIEFSIVSGEGETEAEPTAFPLSVERLTKFDGPKEPHHAPFPRQFIPVFGGGCSDYCLLNVWIGPDAPGSARDAAEQVVASLSAPP